MPHRLRQHFDLSQIKTAIPHRGRISALPKPYRIAASTISTETSGIGRSALGFVEGSPDRARADGVLANFEALHNVQEQFSHRSREKVKALRL